MRFTVPSFDPNGRPQEPTRITTEPVSDHGRLSAQKALSARILNRCAPSGKSSRTKLFHPSLQDGAAKLADEVLIEGDVVPGEERRTEHLTRDEEVSQVSTAICLADRAVTVGIKRSRVALIGRVSNPEWTVVGE